MKMVFLGNNQGKHDLILGIRVRKRRVSMRSWCGVIAAVFTALVLLMSTASATEYSGGGRIGLNVSSIFGDSVQNLTSRVGLNVGLYAGEWFTPRLGLQEELLIDLRGGRWASDPTISNATAFDNYATNFTYLAIPILAKWRFSDNDALRPSVYLGPTFAFPLIAEAEYMGNTIDMMAFTNKFDFDVTVGLSLDIRRGNALIPIDIRYSYGLTNYVKSSVYNAHLRHGVFSISIGLGTIVDLVKNKEKQF
jgi:hypothetical protein